MSTDAQPNPEQRVGESPRSRGAADWAAKFAAELEQEFDRVHEEVAGETSDDYWRSMSRAFVNVLVESGGRPGRITVLIQDALRSVLPQEVEWTDGKSDRRCELVDKDIQGTITQEEQIELAELTHERRVYRRKVAPLPIDDLRELHRELLQQAPDQRDKTRES